MTDIRMPAIVSEDTDEAVKEIRRYLYTLAEQLNYALSQVETGTATVVQQVRDNSQATAVQLTGKASPAQVRDLILKTATIIREEMDQMQTTLQGSMVAVSDFGTYKEQVQNQITANGKLVEQNILAEVGLSGIQEELAGFSEYKVHTEGFIRSGYIDTNEEGVPIIGIAVGRNLEVKTTDKGERIDRNQSCAFYLPDRVSFRMNGYEVAWFSTDGMHTGNIEQSGKTTISGNWEIKNTATNHLSIRWIGG